MATKHKFTHSLPSATAALIVSFGTDDGCLLASFGVEGV
jgi:hypothetical protein